MDKKYYKEVDKTLKEMQEHLVEICYPDLYQSRVRKTLENLISLLREHFERCKNE